MQGRMDELQSKAPSGKMTQADQVLWSKLGELKAETRASFASTQRAVSGGHVSSPPSVKS